LAELYIKLCKAKLERALKVHKKDSWITVLPKVTYTLNQEYVKGTKIRRNSIDSGDASFFVRAEMKKAGSTKKQ